MPVATISFCFSTIRLFVDAACAQSSRVVINVLDGSQDSYDTFQINKSLYVLLY